MRLVFLVIAGILLFSAFGSVTQSPQASQPSVSQPTKDVEIIFYNTSEKDGIGAGVDSKEGSASDKSITL